MEVRTMRRTARELLVGGGLKVLCLLALSSGLEPWAASAQDLRVPITPYGTAQQTDLSAGDPEDTPPEAAIPAQVQALPDIQAKMKVVQRRSQLLVGKSNIAKTAVANGGVVSVVQYSERELAIVGENLGQTTVTLWFDDGSDPLIYLVEVIRDPSLEERRRIDYGKLEKKLALAFPNSKVYLIPLSNKIIVKGQARDAEEATHILSIIRGEVINQSGGSWGPQAAGGNGNGGGTFYDLTGFGPGGSGSYGNGFGNGFANDLWSNMIVNMLEVPGEFQVAVRVRIAELNRSELKRMGVSLTGLINGDDAVLNSVLTGAATNISGVFSAGDISVLIDALSSNGHATILAEPTLVVESGHAASFQAGGDFAVPTTVGISGAAAVANQFRGYGTSIIVTPTILDRDLIRLQISPEFSELNSANAVNGVFGTNLRRVTTTVKLREGQTVALAGLFSRTTQSEIGRLPFLGEIPLIGPLAFSAKRASQDEKELLILVSPEIVRPMEAEEVPPVPGYEVTHPTDKEFFLHNRTAGAPDQRVHQLAPYGHGNGRGVEVGYTQFNPAPADPGYHPQPTQPFGAAGGPTPPFQGLSSPPVGGPGYGAPQPGYQAQPGYQPPQGYPTPQPGYGAPQQMMRQPTPAAPAGQRGPTPAQQRSPATARSGGQRAPYGQPAGGYTIQTGGRQSSGGAVPAGYSSSRGAARQPTRR
jgi:pilus assembly protein CpaC